MGEVRLGRAWVAGLSRKRRCSDMVGARRPPAGRPPALNIPTLTATTQPWCPSRVCSMCLERRSHTLRATGRTQSVGSEWAVKSALRPARPGPQPVSSNQVTSSRQAIQAPLQARQALRRTTQTHLTVKSLPAVAASVPSKEMATSKTSVASVVPCPAITHCCRPSAIPHALAVPSAEALIKSDPLGSMTSWLILFVGFGGCVSVDWVGRALGSDWSLSRYKLGSPTLLVKSRQERPAKPKQQQPKRQAPHLAVCACTVRRSEPPCSSHQQTAPASSPITAVPPSGDTASAVTGDGAAPGGSCRRSCMTQSPMSMSQI